MASGGTPSVFIFFRIAASGSFIFNMRSYMASTVKLSLVLSLLPHAVTEDLATEDLAAAADLERTTLERL